MGTGEDIARAAALMRAGKLDEAQRVAEPHTRGARAHPEALKVMGLIAAHRRDADGAIRHFQRAARVSPLNPGYVCHIAKTMADVGRVEEAVAQYDRTLALDPAFAPAIIFKAQALERLGRITEARSLLEPLVAAGMDSADLDETHATLLLRDKQWDKAARLARRWVDDKGITPRQRNALLTIIGRASDIMGDYDAAFDAYAKAHDKRASWDMGAHTRLIDGLIDTFSPGHMPAQSGLDAAWPILIVGMPRSGTTLVEQIIDAHPHVYGEGENPDLDRVARDCGAKRGSYPSCLADMRSDAVARAGRRHIKAMEKRAGGAQRVVNKHLFNYLHLGLAWMLMPRLRVIHCRRDPLDTCFSCFTNQLSPHTQGYSADLRSLGIVYRENDRLCAHWRRTLGVPWCEVSYEALVANPEQESQRIIDFCGLEWDDACLRFHETGRVVMTLSYDQVRRPMYTASIGRWKNYDKHLGPLKDALGDCLPKLAP